MTKVHTSLKDEHGALDPIERSIILDDARSMLERYSRIFDEAHLNLHVKTAESDGGKSLVRVAANLDTDRGRHSTEAYGFSIDEAMTECLGNIRAQLAKRQEKMADRRTAGVI